MFQKIHVGKNVLGTQNNEQTVCLLSICVCNVKGIRNFSEEELGP